MIPLAGISSGSLATTTLTRAWAVIRLWPWPSARQGTSTSLACPVHQWFFNGAPLPTATNMTLTLHGISAGDAGAYFVVISNYLGTATSTIAVLTVPAAGQLDTWQWRNPLPQGNDLTAVAFGNGLFVGVGEVGASVTSSDGVIWAAQF